MVKPSREPDRRDGGQYPRSRIHLTDEEYEQYKDTACHTNLATGLNILTPLHRLLNVLKRSTGPRKTVALPDPEDQSHIYRASYPLTALGDPSQGMPADIETAIREELREI